MVIEHSSQGVFSRLLKERIVCINGPIDDDTAHVVVAQLLFLESKNPSKPINMYLNSSSGQVTDVFKRLNRCTSTRVTVFLGELLEDVHSATKPLLAPRNILPIMNQLEIEVAQGTYLQQSQVKIMGASDDSENQGRTLVDIDLVPLGEKFDNTIALFTYDKLLL
ncbi:hypothetical protein ACFE04_015445 [Oxalis oulophora]